MIDSIRRTFDPVAVVVTILFTVIGFSVSGLVFGAGQYSSLMTSRQAIELVLFSGSGLIYALILTRKTDKLRLIDLISTAVWTLLCSGVASAAPAFFTSPDNLVSWTVVGIYGELLAGITAACVIVLRDPAALERLN